MPCPQQPFARLVLLPECLCRSLLVRLPAVKVTLPAAIDYTGAHSQAEYNIALEGRFWGLDLRRWALWNFWTTPELVSMTTLLPLVKSWKVVSRKIERRKTWTYKIFMNLWVFISLPVLCNKNQTVCFNQVSMAAVFSQECVKRNLQVSEWHWWANNSPWWVTTVPAGTRGNQIP